MSCIKLAKTATVLAALSLIDSTYALDSGVDMLDLVEAATAAADEAEKTSTVDINEHHQKETFEDVDHDTIEDYSVDKELEQAEHHDLEDLKPIGSGNGLEGFMSHALDLDADKGDEYTEELTTAEGRHLTKKVKKGDGWQQVEISSDGPMDLNDVGGFIGQMMQQQMMRMQQQRAQNAMRQMQMRPIMMGPPPSMLHHMFDDHEEDDHDEDHMAFIREMEARRRRPQPFFGNPIIETIRNDHALVPSDDPLAHMHDEVFGSNHKPHHVHNDAGSHSALYMFGSVFLIAAIGILLWMVAVKDSASSFSDMLKAKQSKGNNSNDTKEIRLSSFNKAK